MPVISLQNQIISMKITVETLIQKIKIKVNHLNKLKDGRRDEGCQSEKGNGCCSLGQNAVKEGR